MMKKHSSPRKFSEQGIFINLYEQVHGTREIESPALPWHTIQMNTYFPKSWFLKLWLFKQKLSPPIPYKYSFGEFASFHLFWGVETKNDALRRYFHRKSNRWDAVTNLLLAEKRQKELRGQEWMKREYDKKLKDEAKQARRI